MRSVDEPLTPTELQQLADGLVAAVGQIMVGKERAVRHALVGLFAGGHVLVEDVPGTGKTTLARALANVVSAQFRRIQFTPDLLPADIVGVNIYHSGSGTFSFRPGPVFAEIVLADEINRATPRTQSALLEAMQESQVSVDGETHDLPDPFMVIATQNPVEMDGTFKLPEAQLDRFMLRLSIGYPEPEEEDAMLARYETGAADFAALETAATLDQVRRARACVSGIKVGESVRAYIRGIAQATRGHENLRLGVSPRGALALQRAAQANAAMNGRGYVLPDDVKGLAKPALGHRVMVETSAFLRGLSGEHIIEELMGAVEVPIERGNEAAPGEA